MALTVDTWDSEDRSGLGRGTVAGSPCFGNVAARIFEGLPREVFLELSPPTEDYALQVTGFVSLDSMTIAGTYRVAGGSPCIGDVGTVRVERVGP